MLDGSPAPPSDSHPPDMPPAGAAHKPSADPITPSTKIPSVDSTRLHSFGIPRPLDYHRTPDIDPPRPGLVFLIGLGGFLSCYGAIAIGLYLGALEGLVLALTISLACMIVLAAKGARSALIGFLIALGLAPIIGCGLCFQMFGRF